MSPSFLCKKINHVGNMVYLCPAFTWDFAKFSHLYFIMYGTNVEQFSTNIIKNLENKRNFSIGSFHKVEKFKHPKFLENTGIP